MAILIEQDPRGWAIQAAKQDSHYLISPRARANAMRILVGDDTEEGKAAKLILRDGGAQQGLVMENGYRYQPVPLDDWRVAADTLGILDREFGE